MGRNVPRRPEEAQPAANQPAANQPAPINRVTAGMRVVDAAGAEIGRVDVVRAGDPNTVTVQAPPSGLGTTLADLINATVVEEPDVPADAEARLRRGGYLKVDGHGVLHDAVYVAADQINDVTDDGVQLSVTRSQLTQEE